MSRFLILSVAALAVAAPLAPALAKSDHTMTGTRMMGTAMERMQDAMAAESTGDVDVDFARMMIPHHQGAIDMAKVVLEHGRDPEIRKLAESIVGAQEAEITQMQAWLRAKGVE